MTRNLEPHRPPDRCPWTRPAILTLTRQDRQRADRRTARRQKQQQTTRPATVAGQVNYQLRENGGKTIAQLAAEK